MPVEVAFDIRKARGVGKPGAVRLDFLYTTAVDGQRIPLQGTYRVEGGSKRGLALGVGLGVGLGTGFLPALFCLCIKGEKVEVPQYTLVSGTVVADNRMIRVE